MVKRKRKVSLLDDRAVSVLKGLTDEALMTFSYPYVGKKPIVDEDGFPKVVIDHENFQDLHQWQKVCWEKAESNPQINSHIRDTMGRMAGWGFEFTANYPELQRDIDVICEDPRNDLYQNMPKYCARTEIEGELFLCFTLHHDGFVEIDFISPSMIKNSGDNNSGIIFHPTKQNFPLFYHVEYRDTLGKHGSGQTIQTLIPSVNVLYYPELEQEIVKHPSYETTKTEKAKAEPKDRNKLPYSKTNGYKRFIVHWNKGFLTKRNISHIKTTIEWVNYYEALKKYEIDHKKSSGAYLWVISVEDPKAFRRWLSLSEEERKKTGVMQPKDPGGTLILPPGMKFECINPKLSSISDQDTDIMQMVSSGLQKPQDVMLGDYRSTYASVKASQGPQGDRINDELHYFRLFLQYSFWRPICWLRSLGDRNFKYYRFVDEVVDFKNKKPVKKKVKKEVYKLIDICLPMSRLEDLKSIAGALLGSKHASVVDTLGIPRDKIAKRMGFPNYHAMRRAKATEDEFYPKTLSVMDQEAAQEKGEAEPKGDPSDKEE